MHSNEAGYTATWTALTSIHVWQQTIHDHYVMQI